MLVKPPSGDSSGAVKEQVVPDLSTFVHPDKPLKASWEPKSQQKDEYHTPKVMEVEDTTRYKRDDPPLIDIKITNPVKYLKLWLKRLLKNEGIDLRVRIRPLTAIAMCMAFATFFAGTGFSVAKIFFPTSSPILKREVSYQGVVQKGGNGYYYLVLSDGVMYKLTPKSKLNLDQYLTQSVSLKGNLTREPNVINVSEVISFNP